MKYYITNNQNAANQVIDLLNSEIIDTLNNDFYFVQRVDADYSDGIKFKVYNENDVFKGYVTIIQKNHITNSYGTYLIHPDGAQYAIPIMDDLKWTDVEQTVKDQALQYGNIVQSLTPDWLAQE